ncbi:hypothetical protein UF75_5152 [Desulfosporosinus sp. I2]|nr:hypothetical protein UF75_5152 [Desulfosporosinus sp. I2]
MKRLDKGSFRWPMKAKEVKQVSVKELRWLLGGKERLKGRRCNGR